MRHFLTTILQLKLHNQYGPSRVWGSSKMWDPDPQTNKVSLSADEITEQPDCLFNSEDQTQKKKKKWKQS